MFSNNPYGISYSVQPNIDRINAQINELEKLKEQIQKPLQPTSLTQNFQLSSQNRDVIRYVSSINDVQNDVITGETPYFSKDMSVVWIKNLGGDITAYELKEIVAKDEKDLQIEVLQSQINELRKELDTNVQYITDVDTTEDEQYVAECDATIRDAVKKSKPNGLPRFTKSKTK